MYCMNRLCFVCLKENNLSKICGKLINNGIYKKLHYCFPEINISKKGSCLYICSSCYSILCDLYKFKKMYEKNFLRWNNYENVLSKNNNDKKDLRIFVYSTSKRPCKRNKFNLYIKNKKQATGKRLCVKKKNNMDDYTVQKKRSQTNNCEYDEEELLFDDMQNNSLNYKYENEYISKHNDQSNGNKFHSDFNVITSDESNNEDDSKKESHTEEVECLLVDTNNRFGRKEQLIEEKVKADKKSGTQLNTTKDLTNIAVCNLCDTICDNDVELQSHQYRKHPILLRCSICNRFIRSESMNHHVKLHKTYECEICNSKFDNNKDFVIHKREHGIKEFTCAMCDRGFPRKESLERHIKSHLGTRLGVKDYECVKCGKKFVQKSALAMHIRNHMGLRNKKCGICGEACLNKQYLNIHMKIHTRVHSRQYECDICNKRFRYKANYNVHTCQVKHMGMDEYNCPICPKVRL